MRQNTAFVIGAGASNDFGLPVGDTLKTNIAQALKQTERQDDAVQKDRLTVALRLVEQANMLLGQPVFKGTQRIIVGMPTAESIDNFVHQHRGDPCIELVAKMAIVHCILKAEHESSLGPSPNAPADPEYVDFTKDQNQSAWIVGLFKAVTQGATPHELEERLRNLSLIIFNYDRCVEHFLFSVFKTHYGFTSAKAKHFMDLITIIHPYGTVGALPWMEHESAATVAFGGRQLRGPDLLHLASNIRTFTESSENNDNFVKAQLAITNADAIAFLGFAFHPLNMRGIMPTSEMTQNEGRDVFGTAYGVSDFQRQRIMHEISQSFKTTKDKVHLLRGSEKCPSVFTEFFLR
ncbi:hypothetical protein [Oceanococcus atlanticus]|uniref:hypothetical protein n=1 Tax=Oceanococcus atlanticus TaxID=1317117 RepID=UPI0009FB2027|nr:hypothetical protein [Oceanococcus atlanticus]